MKSIGINKDDHIITYETSLGARKGASCRAYYLLKLFGHENVSIMEGGVEAW